MTRHFSAAPTAIWNFTVNNLYGCRITTGQYTGDGTLAQAITGVGFAPKAIMVWAHLTVENINVAKGGCVKIDQMANNICASYYWGRSFYDNAVVTLDADGFTVDDDNADDHPNKLAQLYDFVAWG